MGESRGSIAFFGTYRPPVPLDIYSCRADPPPSSAAEDEVLLTDGVSYNQNGQAIPASALKELLTYLGKKKPELLASKCGGATSDDVDKGRVTGLVFVSERDDGLETLHVALRFNGKAVKVVSLADIYGADNFGGVRMEDSGCIAGGFEVEVGRRTVVIGHSLVYVSTKEPARARRTPWTAVYKTNLADGKTERLTPEGQYDLSPSVSPSGKKVAAANFRASRWTGEIEKLKTDIVVMYVDRRANSGKLGREVVIEDGGWPTWGSDDVIFFHRGAETMAKDAAGKEVKTTNWGVFRYDLRTKKTDRVTPEEYDAMTPAAMSESKVAVAIIRQKWKQNMQIAHRVEEQYRHIEIFDVSAGTAAAAVQITPRTRPMGDHVPAPAPVQITPRTRPMGDHYNPFVLPDGRVGYHRCRPDRALVDDKTGIGAMARKFDKLRSPVPDVGLLRGTGVFPTVCDDGSRIAFVDNEFKAVWVADANGLRMVYKPKGVSNLVFSTAWSKKRESNKEKGSCYEYDTLFVCVGPAFSADVEVGIYAISKLHSNNPDVKLLTINQDEDGNSINNAFPSSNADGTRLVFRSTRHGGAKKHKNLYIMYANKEESESDLVDKEEGDEMDDPEKTYRLTEGDWTDTHCSWSPSGDWIVFSSTRDMPKGPTAEKGLLDAGHFAIYLVKADDKNVLVRVVQSSGTVAGHTNHPMFSSDMRSIVFASDLAAVSADPISMPIFMHSVRPYGDIFSVDLRDSKDDLKKNKDITQFRRITHSRYEYSTPTWTKMLEKEDPNDLWSLIPDETSARVKPACPYMHAEAVESWHMTGHLTIAKRCC